MATRDGVSDSIPTPVATAEAETSSQSPGVSGDHTCGRSECKDDDAGGILAGATAASEVTVAEAADADAPVTLSNADLFATHGIAFVEDLVSKWDEGFKEVYCAGTGQNKKTQAAYALLKDYIDSAMLEDLMKLKTPDGKARVQLKAIKNAGLKIRIAYAIKFLRPLNELPSTEDETYETHGVHS